MAEGGAKTWLKYGCFGCAAILGVLILLGGLMFGVAALKSRTEKIADRQVTRDLPAPEIPQEPDAAAVEPGELDAMRPGRVILDLRHAGFTIEPARSGEPIRVEATFDENSYELVEEFEPEAEEGWVYRVSFRRTGMGLITTIKEALSGNQPEVRLFLPPDAPLLLSVDVGQGALEADLGGLWVTAANFDMSQGAIDLDFSEPLRAPMDELTFEFSMGGVRLASVGNASPAVLDVDYSMSGIELDLRGLWIQDSEISIRGKMAGGDVRLPRDVVIEGIERYGSLGIEPEPEVKPPTLRFTIDVDDPDNINFRD